MFIRVYTWPIMESALTKKWRPVLLGSLVAVTLEPFQPPKNPEGPQRHETDPNSLTHSPPPLAALRSIRPRD